MYRLLIVEDEKWEREGLRDFLDWSGLGIEVAGCACNGAEGLKMAELYRPEIVITDIMMPKMDGIRMSQNIRAFLPETKIIILTGHDDFQYAKQTFGFHAFSYVLKPVGKKNLEEVFFSLLKVLDREKGLASERKALERQWTNYLGTSGDRFLLDLLEGKIDLKYINGLTSLNGLDLKGKKVTAILSLFYSPAETIPGVITKRTESGLMTAFGDMMRRRGIAFSFTKAFKEAVILIDAPDTEQELEQQLLRLRDSLLNELGMKVVIGVGAAADDFTGVPQSYIQAREAIRFGFLAEYGELLFYAKIKETGIRRLNEAESLILKTSGIAKKIAFGIQKGDSKENIQLVDDFLSTLRENLMIGKLLLVSFFTEVAGYLNANAPDGSTVNKRDDVWNENESTFAFDTLDSLSQTRRYIMDFLKRAAALVPNNNRYEDEIAQKVIDIIEREYAYDLDLKKLSEEIHLTPYYIGSIFKKYTGKAFSQYLNDYRIDMAKEILQSGKIKVSQLAEAVGIRSSSYFCSLFKSRFGISPGEYKEILKGRWERV